MKALRKSMMLGAMLLLGASLTGCSPNNITSTTMVIDTEEHDLNCYDRENLEELFSQLYTDSGNPNTIFTSNFKYEKVYTKNIVYASFNDEALPLTFIYDALPTSVCYIKSNNKYYTELHSSGYGAKNIPVEYYFISNDSMYMYLDMKDSIGHRMEYDTETRFMEFENKEEPVVRFEENVRTEYKDLNVLMSDPLCAYQAIVHVYHECDILDKYYLTLSGVDKINSSNDIITSEKQVIKFKLSNDYYLGGERYTSLINGEFDYANHSLIYTAVENRTKDDKAIDTTEYTVSFVVTENEISIPTEFMEK